MWLPAAAGVDADSGRTCTTNARHSSAGRGFQAAIDERGDGLNLAVAVGRAGVTVRGHLLLCKCDLVFAPGAEGEHRRAGCSVGWQYLVQRAGLARFRPALRETGLFTPAGLSRLRLRQLTAVRRFICSNHRGIPGRQDLRAGWRNEANLGGLVIGRRRTLHHPARRAPGGLGRTGRTAAGHRAGSIAGAQTCLYPMDRLTQ